ncbi:MAG: prepilin-type N-terminal cleavage/methylation domain-containing protein [Gemmatimonadetes bacterium]|nr:prepilin-type N-terminal cleavage/methylation domain-containing protein [Gemmatimonadota bacterium]MBI3567873.1 prepilin-type N-terminal cleavage/methylation domain-containing protein [Gemmatimonadota bacterium]
MWQTRRVERRSTAGVTLIEILIVIVIIGIVAGFGIPRLGQAGYRADAAARLVRMQMQLAQRAAITRQSNQVVNFDLTNNKVILVQDYNNNDSLDVNDRQIGRHLEEGTKFTTPNWAGPDGHIPTGAVTGTQLNTFGGLQGVIFRRDGSASTDAMIYVTNRDAVKTEYRAIWLTQGTGKTDMYKWNGTSWIRMNQ